MQLQDKPLGLLGKRWRLNWEKRVLRSAEVAVIEEGVGMTWFRLSTENEFISTGGEVLVFSSEGAVCTRRDGARETYGADGRLREVDRRNGNKIHLRYDVEGQLVRIDGPFQSFFRFISDNYGRITQVKSSSGAVVEYHYGAPPAAASADGVGLAVDYDYNGRGLLERSTHPTAGTTQFAYDLRGRVVKRTRSDGTFEEYAYVDDGKTILYTDPAGRVTKTKRLPNDLGVQVTDPTGATRRIHFDLAGRPTTVIGPTRQSAHYRYDRYGRIESVENSLEGETHFEYEQASHKPVAQVDPDGTRQQFQYDDNLNLLSLTSSNGAGAESTEYYANGLVKKVRTPDGQSAAFTYDQRGRPSSIETNGLTIKVEFDARGNLVRLVDPLEGEIRYEYDQHDRLRKVANSDGSFEQYEYSEAGLLTRQSDHKNRWLAYQYDQRGRVVKETDHRGNVTSYQYAADGQLTSIADGRGNRGRVYL